MTSNAVSATLEARARALLNQGLTKPPRFRPLEQELLKFDKPPRNDTRAASYEARRTPAWLQAWKARRNQEKSSSCTSTPFSAAGSAAPDSRSRDLFSSDGTTYQEWHQRQVAAAIAATVARNPQTVDAAAVLFGLHEGTFGNNWKSELSTAIASQWSSASAHYAYQCRHLQQQMKTPSADLIPLPAPLLPLEAPYIENRGSVFDSDSTTATYLKHKSSSCNSTGSTAASTLQTVAEDELPPPLTCARVMQSLLSQQRDSSSEARRPPFDDRKSLNGRRQQPAIDSSLAAPGFDSHPRFDGEVEGHAAYHGMCHDDDGGELPAPYKQSDVIRPPFSERSEQQPRIMTELFTGYPCSEQRTATSCPPTYVIESFLSSESADDEEEDDAESTTSNTNQRCQLLGFVPAPEGASR